MIITFLDIVTLLVTAFLSIRAFPKFANSARYLTYYTFVIFYVVPIALDYSLGFNDYSISCQGFDISRKDITTSAIYDIFVIFTQFILLFYKRKKYSYSKVYKQGLASGEIYLPPKSYKYVWLGVVIGPLWMYFHSGIQFLFLYQWRELRIFSLPPGYAVAECLSYIGITCSILLIFRNFTSNKLLGILQKTLAALFLYINICIEGKRAVLFFALCNIIVIFLFFFIYRKNISVSQRLILRIGSVISLTIIALYMISISFETQRNRGSEVDQITLARIDFLRDDRVRMAIYAELNPDQMQITEHALQTIPDAALSLFPLNFLSSRINKDVIMYQTRFTCAMSGEDTSKITGYEKEHFSWMTTSITAEIISNFGLILGILLIPFVFIWIVKLVNKYPSPFNMLIFNSFFMLNLFDFSYVSYYIEGVAVLLYFYHRTKQSQIQA